MGTPTVADIAAKYGDAKGYGTLTGVRADVEVGYSSHATVMREVPQPPPPPGLQAVTVGLPFTFEDFPKSGRVTIAVNGGQVWSARVIPATLATGEGKITGSLIFVPAIRPTEL